MQGTGCDDPTGDTGTGTLVGTTPEVVVGVDDTATALRVRAGRSPRSVARAVMLLGVADPVADAPAVEAAR